MRVAIVLVGLVLTGCSFILPRPHDSELFGNLVDVKISLNKTNCTDKNWDDLNNKVERLKVYTELRKDPQAKAVADMKEALKKAHDSSNLRFCESILSINKTRVDVIVDAWRGR